MTRDQRDREALCKRIGHDWGRWYRTAVQEPFPPVTWRFEAPSPTFEPVRYTAQRWCKCCGVSEIDRSNEK